MLQMEGYNILTDPHFSKRTSPVQWAGPERVAPLGLAFEDLPPIDIVVISHDHFDALDEANNLKITPAPGRRKDPVLCAFGAKKLVRHP